MTSIGGIYLGLVAAAHGAALGEGSISYRELQLPGFEDFDEAAQGQADNEAAEGQADNDEAVS